MKPRKRKHTFNEHTPPDVHGGDLVVLTADQYKGLIRRLMPPKTKVTRFQIARLKMSQGDTLVVKTDLLITRQQSTDLAARFKEYVPDSCKVMVLSAGLETEILTVREALSDKPSAVFRFGDTGKIKIPPRPK